MCVEYNANFPIVDDQEEQEPTPSVFQIPAPSTGSVDPLEADISLYPSNSFNLTVTDFQKTYDMQTERLNKVAAEFKLESEKVESISSNLVQNSVATKEEADRFAESKISVEKFSNAPEDIQKEELKKYSDMYYEGVYQNVNSMNMKDEDKALVFEQLDAIRQVYEPQAKRFVATPNGTVNPASIFATSFMVPFEVHKKEKTDLYWVLSSKEIRQDVMDSFEKDSSAYLLVKSIDENIEKAKKEGKESDLNYFNDQETYNMILVNSLSTAFVAGSKLAFGAMGLKGALSLALGKGAVAGAVASAGAFAIPILIMSAAMIAYYESQSRDVNKQTTEYYRMLNEVDLGKYSFEQVSKAFSRGVKPEFFTKDGEFNSALFEAAQKKGIDTYVSTSTFPTYNLHKSLGAGNVIAHLPRAYEYDEYSIKGDFLGEVVGTALVSLPMALFDRRSAAGNIVKKFTASEATAYYATKASRELIGQFSFDLLQGYTMQHAMSIDQFAAAMEYTREMPLGFVTTPLVQQVMNVGLKTGLHFVGTKMFNNPIADLALAKASKEYMDTLHTLRFASIGSIHANDIEAEAGKYIKASTEGLKANSWIDAVHVALADDSGGIPTRNSIEARKAIHNAIRENAFEDLSISTSRFSGSDDQSVAALTTLKNMLSSSGVAGDTISRVMSDTRNMVENGKRIVTSIMDDTQFLNSSIEKYTESVDGKAIDKIGMFRTVEVTLVDGTVLPIKVGISDMVDIYNSFFPRIEGDTKVLGARGRISILKEFEEDANKLFLNKNRISNLDDVDTILGKSQSIIHDMIRSNQLSIETIDQMRDGFVSDTYTKMLNIKALVSDEDFEAFLTKSLDSANYGLGKNSLERSLSSVLGKITNIITGHSNLVARFHQQNVENRIGITGSILSDVIEKYKITLDDVNKSESEKGKATAALNEVTKVVMDDLERIYGAENSTNKTYLAAINEFRTALDTKVDDEAIAKEVSLAVYRMAVESGHVDSYRGLLEDLVKLDSGLAVVDGIIRYDRILNQKTTQEAMSRIFEDGALFNRILTSVKSIQESGFGGIYSSLKTIQDSEMFRDINVLEHFNIKEMLGYSMATPTLLKIESSAKDKIRKFRDMVLYKDKKYTKEDIKRVSSVTSLTPDEKKLIEEGFTFNQLKGLISEAAITKRIGYQLMLDMQKTRSFISGESLKSISSAMLQLHDALNKTEPNEVDIYRARKALKYALLNSGNTPDIILNTIKEVSSRIVGMNDLDTDRTKLDTIINLLKDASDDVTNPIIKDLIESEDGIFISDLMKALGMGGESSRKVAEYVVRFLSLDGSPKSLFGMIQSVDSEDLISKFSRRIIDINAVEYTKGGKISASWIQRNEMARESLGELWSTVIGRQQWNDIVVKGLNDINRKLSEDTNPTTARVLDYESIVRYLNDSIKEVMYQNNKVESSDERFKSSIFSTETKEEFGRKVRMSFSSISNLPKISNLFTRITGQVMDVFGKAMSGSPDKNEDTVLKAADVVYRLSNSNPDIMSKVKGIVDSDASVEEKLMSLEKETKSIVENKLPKAILSNVLSDLGFGGLKQDGIDFVTASKQVAELNKNIPILAILPNLKYLTISLDGLKKMGMGISKLNNDIDVQASLNNIKIAFSEFKEMIINFKNNKVFNLLPEDTHRQLYNAIENSTAKAENMINDFDSKFNNKNTSKEVKSAMLTHSKDYFSSAFGWTSFLNTVMKNFASNMIGFAEKQNNLLFSDNITQAARRAFGSIDKTQFNVLMNRTTQAERLLSDNSSLSKTSYQIKQIWSSITNSSLYQKKFKRTVLDPYYGLNPEFVSDFRKFNIERDDVVARIGTIAARLGLNPKNTKSIKDFGRSSVDFIKFKDGDVLSTKKATAFNILFEGSGVKLTENSDDTDIINAKRVLISRVLDISGGKKTDWREDIIARNIANYLDVFEKNGILDLVLEHSAEYFVSKDKLNSFSTDPELSAEKQNILKTWNKKLMEAIEKKTGKSSELLVERVKQEIRDTIGPEASLEDALIFNSLLLNDFTGKLIIAAAIDDSVLKYVGTTMPKLYDGAIQIRSLVDYANIIGVKYGELGLDTAGGMSRENMLINLIGTEDTNYTRLVDNPINIQSQKFYVMSHLQHAHEELQLLLHNALNADNLLDKNLTAQKLRDNQSKTTYYVTLPDLTKTLSGSDGKPGKSQDVYIAFDMEGNQSALALGERALFGNIDGNSESFALLQAGKVNRDDVVSSGLSFSEKNGVVTVNFTEKNLSKFLTTHNKTMTPEDVTKNAFSNKKVVIAIKLDRFNKFKNYFTEAQKSLLSKIRERDIDINKSYQKLMSLTSVSSTFSLMREWKNSKDEIQKSFATEFDNLLHRDPDLASHAIELSKGFSELPDVEVRIVGVGADTRTMRESLALSGAAVEGQIEPGLTKSYFPEETINTGGRTKSWVEKLTVAQLNEKLWGISSGTVPTNKYAVDEYYNINKGEYAKLHLDSPRTININGVEITNVVRVINFEDHDSVKAASSNKPDIVIDVLEADGSIRPIYVSHKADSSSAEFMDSSDSLILKTEATKSATIYGILDFVSRSLEGRFKDDADAKSEALTTMLTQVGYSISEVLDIKTLNNILKEFAMNTDALARAFGSLITAEDMVPNMGRFSSPFSRDGIRGFITDIRSALINAAVQMKKENVSLQDLLSDSNFKEIVWNQMLEINPWLKAYTKLQATPEKFTDLTHLFLQRVFLDGGVSSKTEGGAKDAISILKTLGTIDDPANAYKSQRRKKATIEDDDLPDNLVTKAVDRMLKNSLARQRSEIGNFDKSIAQLLALRPDALHNLQNNVNDLIQKIQLGNFVTRMVFDSGAIRYIGRENMLNNDNQLTEDEANGLIKLSTLGELKRELPNVYPEFVKLLLKSDKIQADMVEDLYKDIYTQKLTTAMGANTDNVMVESVNRYHNNVQKLLNENDTMSSIKLALSKDLYEQLSFLNQKLTPKNIGNTFGAQLLDVVNSLMTYFTTNFSGAVLVWNHVSWMRNFMGAVLQASLSTGDIFTGLEYTLKAMNDINNYSKGLDSGQYSRFLRENKNKPLTMARYGVTAHTIDMSSLDRERHAAFKAFHTIFNKPLEIVNSGLYKTLGAVLNQDPTNIEARMRAGYGAIDNITRYALWKMAKEGKARAPEDYSSLSSLISQDYALKRSIEKAFSSDVVNTISANGKYLAPMSDSDASAFSRKFSFVYDELPDAWKLVRAVWNPFASFTYNSYRILYNSMTTYPARVAGLYLALSVANNAILKDKFGIDVSLNSFIPNMDVFSWALGDSENMDFLNLANPSAPFMRFARSVMEQRDPFTRQDMSSFGAGELLLRSYINSFLPIAPTAHYAARTGIEVGKHLLGYEDSHVADRGKLAALFSLIPESYLYKRSIEQGWYGRPLDKYGTTINPLAGFLYGAFGLNIRPADRLKSQLIIKDFERMDKSLTTQINNLSKRDVMATNKDIQMEIRMLEKRREANAERSIDAFDDVFGEVPDHIKENYLYNNPFGYVEAVKDYITESWRDLLSTVIDEYGRKADISIIRR